MTNWPSAVIDRYEFSAR